MERLRLPSRREQSRAHSSASVRCGGGVTSLLAFSMCVHFVQVRVRYVIYGLKDLQENRIAISDRSGVSKGKFPLMVNLCIYLSLTGCGSWRGCYVGC